MKKLSALIGLLLCTVSLLVAEETTDIVLKVTASEKNAVVKINNKNMGQTPLEITTLKPGFYIIQVEKKGFYPWKNEIALNEGDSVVLYAELDRIQGTIALDCEPKRVQILIDDEIYEPGDTNRDPDFLEMIQNLMYMDRQLLKVDEGIHTLKLRSFGYKDYSQDVVIFRKTVTPVEVVMERIPFNVSGLENKLYRFNPQNPGGLGTVTIPFRVTGPGSAEVHVLNPRGEVIATRFAGPFTTWENSFTWDGKSDSWDAPILPDGTYTVEFLFEGDGLDTAEPVLLTKTVAVEIDSSLTYELAFLGETGISAGSVPLALLSPANSVQIDFDAGAVLQTATGSVAAVPLNMAFEYTVSDRTSFSAGDTIYLDPYTGSPDRNVLTGAFRWMFQQGALSAGMAVRYQWINQPLNIELYDRNGGLAAEFMTGSKSRNGFYAGLSVGVIYGNECGLLVNPVLHIKEGAAINYQTGRFSCNVFGTLYNRPASALFDGAEAGAGLRVILGQTNVLFSAGGKAVFRPAEPPQIRLSAGLSILG